MSREPLIELQEVSLVYRALPALRDISWRFERGEQWACLGPNGAGKTSLANVLSRQATHFSGRLQRSTELGERGVAYVCFEQAKALCDRLVLARNLPPLSRQAMRQVSRSSCEACM